MNIDKISEKTGKKKFYYILARNIALTAGLFTFIVSLFMITNFVRIKTSDPLNSPELRTLITKIQEDPGNKELKETMRGLDLLARKAFFSSLVFTEKGAVLILFGLVVLLIALKTMSGLKPSRPVILKKESGEEILEDRRTAVWAIGGLGAAIIIVSLMLPYFLISNKTSSEEPEKIIDLSLADTETNLGNWPAFRGHNGLGISGAKEIPVKWNGKANEGICWKSDIPKPGKSSPVIWGKHLFLTGGDEKSQEVYCYNIDSGELLWQKSVKKYSGESLEITEGSGFAAPSAVSDGRQVYAIFPTGILTCFDFKGKEVWTRNLGVPINNYGHSSSLIMGLNKLFIQFDHDKGPKLIAVNPETGKTLWEQKRPVAASWASPILADDNGQMKLVLNAAPFVMAYDAETGKELWRVECMAEEEVASSPAYSDGIVFSANENAKLVAIDIKTGKILWEKNDDLPDVSSPLAVKGYLFMGNSGGVLTCYDQKTGAILWKHEFSEGFYSSPVFAEDKIYLMDRQGKMLIIKADKKFDLIGSNELGESSSAIPAIIQGRIYIRGSKALFCIGVKK